MRSQIPKIIHYCWYGGQAPGTDMQRCLASWQEYLPEYKVIKWDESNTPFKTFPFLKHLRDRKQWSFLSDFTRLYALYHFGGIYLDTDVELLDNFDPLVSEEVFIGFQHKSIAVKHPVNSAVLGALPYHPFINKALEETIRVQSFDLNPMGGPPVVSKILREEYGLSGYGDQRLSGVRILPCDYFYPFAWNEKYYPECITANTICIHWWSYSWSGRTKNLNYYLSRLQRRMNRIPFVVKNYLCALASWSFSVPR